MDQINLLLLHRRLSVIWTAYLSERTGEEEVVGSAADWACSRLVVISVFEGVAQEMGLVDWLLARDDVEALESVDRRRRLFSLPGD